MDPDSTQYEEYNVQPKARSPFLKDLLEVSELCDRVRSNAPVTLQGVDRMRYLWGRVEELTEAERDTLRTFFEGFMRHAINEGASDFDGGADASRGNIWLRIDGEKKVCSDLGRYTFDDTNILFLNVLTPWQVEHLFERFSVDLSYQVLGGVDSGEWHRFRVTVYFDNDNLALNFRIIGNELRKLESLGFHPTIANGMLFEHVRDGLTLVTGVTGSGKSTTLDSVIDANNRRVSGHIVILGNPIEYIHLSNRCIVRHREIGKDVTSFRDGIVQSLRQDPDIIVIGEMRDKETMEAALEVTDSGHKVFSTLHTSSAIETIARVVAEFPPEEQDRVRYRLADTLRCVVSQKLLPKIGGGRVLAKEVLWMTPAARAAIKNNNVDELYQMMWEGRGQGQTTLEQDLLRLAKMRHIDASTVMSYANNKRRMKQIMM